MFIVPVLVLRGEATQCRRKLKQSIKHRTVGILSHIELLHLLVVGTGIGRVVIAIVMVVIVVTATSTY